MKILKEIQGVDRLIYTEDEIVKLNDFKTKIEIYYSQNTKKIKAQQELISKVENLQNLIQTYFNETNLLLIDEKTPDNNKINELKKLFKQIQKAEQKLNSDYDKLIENQS